MKNIIKLILTVLGYVPFVRLAWLTATRWLFLHVHIPIRVRDFLMWDMSTYILGLNFEVPVKLATGVSMIGGMGDQISRFILFYSGWEDYLWEPQTLKLVLKLLPVNGQVFVAGAHIGYHALHLALKARGGRVFAFEPVQSLFTKLSKNFLTAKLSSLTIENMALSQKSAEAVSLSVAGMRSSIDVTLTEDIETVKAVSLDDYVAERKISQVGLIFLDVEGSELNVLRGATKLLQTLPDLILEVNRPGLFAQGLSPDLLYDFLRQKGYKLFFIEDDYFFTLRNYDPSVIELRPIISEDKKFHPEMRSFNIFATPYLDKVDSLGVRVLKNQPIRFEEIQQ